MHYCSLMSCKLNDGTFFFFFTMPGGQFDLQLPCSWFSRLTESDPWPADKRKGKNRFNETRVKHLSHPVINNRWEQLRHSPLQLYQPWNGRSLRRVWTCSGWAGPPLQRVWDAWWGRTGPPVANSYLTKEKNKNQNRQIGSLGCFLSPHKLVISYILSSTANICFMLFF